MFTLTRHSEQNGSYRHATLRFRYLDEAVWASRETSDDYIIEEDPCGIALARVVRYRMGTAEMI